MFRKSRAGLAGQQFVQQAEPGGGQDVQADVPEQVQRLHAPFREVQFQQHRLHSAELPAHIADDIGKIPDQPAVLVRRGLLGLGDDRSEHEVQQRTALQVLLGDVVLRLVLDFPDGLFFLRGQDGAEQAVGEDGAYFAMVEVPDSRFLPQVLLHRRHGGHQGIDGAARQRATHRHVDTVVLRRDGVQQGHQEVLVGQDEGRLHRISGVAAREDSRSKLCLAHGRRHAHNVKSGHSEAVRIHREGIREIPDILVHEDRGL